MQLFGTYTRKRQYEDFTHFVALCLTSRAIVDSSPLEEESNAGGFISDSVQVEYNGQFFDFECKLGDLTEQGLKDFNNLVDETILKEQPVLAPATTLNYQDESSILAGLRLLQNLIDGEGIKNHDYKLPHFDDVAPLNSKQIDALCESIALNNLAIDTPDSIAPLNLVNAVQRFDKWNEDEDEPVLLFLIEIGIYHHKDPNTMTDSVMVLEAEYNASNASNDAESFVNDNVRLLRDEFTMQVNDIATVDVNDYR
jgi:hypothetical protein